MNRLLSFFFFISLDFINMLMFCYQFSLHITVINIAVMFIKAADDQYVLLLCSVLQLQVGSYRSNIIRMEFLGTRFDVF